MSSAVTTETRTFLFPLPPAGGQPGAGQLIADVSPQNRKAFINCQLYNSATPAPLIFVPTFAAPGGLVPYGALAFLQSRVGGQVPSSAAPGAVQSSFGVGFTHVVAPGSLVIVDLPAQTRLYGNVVGTLATIVGVTQVGLAITTVAATEPLAGVQTRDTAQAFGETLQRVGRELLNEWRRMNGGK